ncbi:MAG: peroxiredoxin Q/BCP [Alphaproteobacteria bacterium]|jgi:peroxiredoxin Q/BCP
MLEIGSKAPEFSLPNQNGEQVKLSALSDKWVILYFYPKALTPGCTVQACALATHKEELDKLNAVAVGVSADRAALLKRFEEIKDLNFTLLGDESENHDMLRAYQAWGLKKFMGREYDGIHRITYIINPEGKIAHTIEKVKTKTHHEEVITFLQSQI